MLSAAELEELDRRLKDLICPVCIERRIDGTCSLSALRQCPITMHLPGLVSVTESVHSNRMDAYIQAVREQICANCRAPLFPRGGCDARREGRCALDAYLLLIVQGIDDYLAQKLERKEVAG